MRAPRTVRPLYAEYKVMGEVLRIFNNDYYHLTVERFTSVVMKLSGGQINPEKVRQIYFNLMEDAGLKPLYEKKNEKDKD